MELDQKKEGLSLNVFKNISKLEQGLMIYCAIIGIVGILLATIFKEGYAKDNVYLTEMVYAIYFVFLPLEVIVSVCTVIDYKDNLNKRLVCYRMLRAVVYIFFINLFAIGLFMIGAGMLMVFSLMMSHCITFLICLPLFGMVIKKLGNL